ncbi:MAG: radical SAM protein, partial [Rhodocyclales bacterium]|nr:radical SAM protein [Rhodocyclales bacterium]
MNQTQILFIPIMGCNLACPYCHFTWHGKGTWSAYGNQRRQHLDMLDAWEWLEAFDPFAPYHLEITGGEPTIYPGLATLLGMLPDGCTWSITSNCLASVPYLPSAARCTSWTSSWHGRQFERFCGELERLEGMGHRPSVSVVA